MRMSLMIVLILMMMRTIPDIGIGSDKINDNGADLECNDHI